MAAERFPVEASHIMMFARSVYDDNPVYYDAEYAAGTEAGAIIAPPTFMQAAAQFDPAWPLRPRINQPWFGSGANPSGIDPDTKSENGGNAGTLHAEQHFEYHRHPRVGDVLCATVLPGRTWEKEGRRAGKLIFNETITEYRDQGGELAVTVRGVGVRTERPATQNQE
ncbi:MAG: MaoC family dehydratase N-terminal domain-containing protein [Gammaproteobacteria bacterium]|nr:MaoC family dehydratase N-terminal domain-containing protein [Gammaproteobacteria bacterium]